MEKPTFKLVGPPASVHGQYTFYKTMKVVAETERTISVGDFFFVKIWQDSELISIGELQLLWTDRVSDQTLVSLRLYFLPENTPDGRNGHGEDEVLAINERVCVRANDMVSWLCAGGGWRGGLRAGGGAAAAEPSVVVFSYPRYCRYRAIRARLAGAPPSAIDAALGGYIAENPDTRIHYCRDTFEYPELEGHEFVCNQLAPRARARPRRHRRHQRRASNPPDDNSEDERSSRERETDTSTSLPLEPEHVDRAEEKAFIKKLKAFYKERGGALKLPRGLRDSVSLLTLWRGAPHPDTLTTDALRHVYDRYLLPYARHERRKHQNAQKLDSETGETEPIKSDSEPVSTDVNTAANLKTDTKIDIKTDINRSEVKTDTEKIQVKSDDFNSEKVRDVKSGGIRVKSDFSDKNVPQDLVMVRSEEKQENRDNVILAPTPPMSEVSRSPLAALGTLADTYAGTNGHNDTAKAPNRARSSLRSVRVKPARASLANTDGSAIQQPRPDSASSSPPTRTHTLTHTHTNHVTSTDNQSDDEIVEVPYKPKTPEIIDLDDYPESPQSNKKRKLDILKERGLEVTAVPPIWQVPIANMATPILPFMVYNVPPQFPEVKPPSVLQAKSIFGSSVGLEKTVYGHPKDPYMPPPHILRGAPIKPTRSITPLQTPAQDILDLTCAKSPGLPSVEIVRVPSAPSRSTTPQNLTKNYTIVDGKAVVGSNLEITLVNKPNTTPVKPRPQQKRSSNGKFLAKTPTPPKEQKPVKKPNIVIPNYQIREDPSKDLLNMYKNYEQSINVPHKSYEQSKAVPPVPQNVPLVEPSYMNALYSSLASQMDHRQLAFYRELMANQFRNYGLLNMGVGTPTTKN